MAQWVKNLSSVQEMQVWPLGWEDLEEGLETRSSILAWRIPWTEESGKLQSVGSQRLRLAWSDWARTELVHCLLARCLPWSPCCLTCFLEPWVTFPHCAFYACITLPRQPLAWVLPWPSSCSPTHLFVFSPSLYCGLFPPKCRQAQIQNIVDEQLSSTVPRTRLEENRKISVLKIQGVTASTKAIVRNR